MRLFLDTNVVLEFIDHRKYYEEVRLILRSIMGGEHVGVISQGTVYTLAYLVERMLKSRGIHRPEQTEQLRNILVSVLRLFEPTGITRGDMIRAVCDKAYTDLEDSLQYQCAVQNRCPILITVNINDFADADKRGIEILTPLAFVEKYL